MYPPEWLVIVLAVVGYVAMGAVTMFLGYLLWGPPTGVVLWFGVVTVFLCWPVFLTLMFPWTLLWRGLLYSVEMHKRSIQ